MQRINTGGALFTGYQMPGVALDGNPLQITNVVPSIVADRYFKVNPLHWNVIPVDASGMPADRELCIKYLAWLDARYPGHNFAELYAEYLRATDPVIIEAEKQRYYKEQHAETKRRRLAKEVSA